MNQALATLFVLLLTACAATESGAPARPASASPWPSLDEADWSEVRALDGEEINLAAAAEAGRAVALVFWLPWCASCLEEGPTVAEAARTYADELLIVGIVSGPDGDVDDGEVEAVIDHLGLDYPHVRDRDLAVAQDLAIRGTPTIVVFGRDGLVAKRSSHVSDWGALVAGLR